MKLTKPFFKIAFVLIVFHFSFWITPTATCQIPINQLPFVVNPFIGTGGHGHTFPGPTMPFGACQLSPDTRLEGWDGCSGYHYSDSVIFGFSHTHLSGTGCSDYGDILLMPVTQRMTLDNYQYASKFSHKNEQAHAGYYQVYLETPKVNVELTSTLHGGMHRYTFQKNDEQYVVLDLKHRDEVLDSKMEKVDDYTIRGYRFSKAWAKNQKVFFEIKFSKPIEEIQYEEVKTGSNTSAVRLDKSLHCIIKFQKENSNKEIPNSKLLIKCAISGVDEDGAHKNLVLEMPDANWDFDSYQKKAEHEWEKELSKIQIENEGMGKFENLKMTDSQIVFYTALYHCMIHPSLYNDVDGRYRGRDDKIHNTEGKFDYYTVFSLWDTYRALHPLLTILDKKRTNDFINTFIKQYEQGGRLPIWELSSNETNCMIGYHVVSVIWDAYNKGIRDYDEEKAYEAMKSIATQESDYSEENSKNQIPKSKNLNEKNTSSNMEFGISTLKLSDKARGRCADADALESYNKYGYVRSDDSHESVSKTLEYAYDDWCIAQMAKALGEEKDYDYYLDRSHNWMNVYDPTTGFMRARKNGCLYQPFSPYTVDNNYTEANAWQYSFYVPHDFNSLIYLHGGKEKFEQKLDDLFSAKEKTEGREQADITGLIGQYAHGNEPSHQIAYLYNYISKPQKAQKIINYIIDSFYTNQPDGLIGNEDCGQMSAWYVMNTLGLYATCPGDNQFDISIPQFDTSKLMLVDREYDRIYTIINQNSNTNSDAYENMNSLSEEFHYDENNKLINDEYVKKIYLGNKLNVDFINKGVGLENFIREGLINDIDSLEILSSVPFIKIGTRIFYDSLKIEINNLSKNAIYYSLNNKDFYIYEKPFSIFENTNISFFSDNKITKFGIAKMRKGACKTFAIPNQDTKLQTGTFTKLPTDRKIILHNEFSKSYSAGGAEGLMDGIYGKLNWRAGDWQGYQGQDVEVIMAFDKARPIKKLAANFLEDQNSWIFYPKQVSFYVSKDSVNWTLVNAIPTNKSDKNLEVSITKFETTYQPIKLENYKFAKVVAQSFGPMPQWHEGRGNPTYIFMDEFEVE